MKLIADALDLQHRLPKIWRLVEDLAVEPWKARQVAPRLASCGFTAIQTAVAMAIAKYHPELLERRETTGKKGWHVTLRHPTPGDFDGTSYLDVAGDTLDLTAFHDLVCDQAAQLKALGDTDDLEIRKAKALGVLASQQATLDLVALTGDDDTLVIEPAATSRAPKPKTRLYLHLSLTDLLELRDGQPVDGEVVGAVEKLGPATLDKIREWVGHSQVSIRPVLDLASTDSVDEHDPPEWMREIVILRDGHCVFPWCTVDARATDLDHIVPYVPMDQGGPPAQTNPHNLACLCRRHHRCKTSGRWRYRRRDDGTHEWHGPTAAATSSPHSAPSRSQSTDRSRPDHRAATGPSGLPCCLAAARRAVTVRPGRGTCRTHARRTPARRPGPARPRRGRAR